MDTFGGTESKLEGQELEILEKRLAVLEKRVFGDSQNDFDNEKCVDILVNFSNKLGNATTGHDRVAAIFRRVAELESYLDPTFGQESSLSDGVKLDIILSQEKELKDNQRLLQKVQELKPVLESEHIKGITNMCDQLDDLCQKQLIQNHQIEKLDGETKKFIHQYDNIITTITKNFIHLDDIITKYELASQQKPKLDEDV